VTRAPRIAFFADAGAAVGGGHVMRCLTLAEALGRAGAVCAFATTPEAAAVLDAFAPKALARLAVPAGEVGGAVAAAAEAVRAWGARAVVLDHYGAGLAEEAALRRAAPMLVVLDDLKRPHACDLVLDSSLGRSAADYPGLAALTGPAFALVRPAFAASRAESLARRARGGAVARLLIGLGLTDVGAITGRVVDAVLPTLGEVGVDVVVGAGAASLSGLRHLAARDPRLALHVDTPDMAALTARADLAIGAGGSSVWERCCLGLPALTLVLADNQRANSDALARTGAVLTLDATAADFDARLALAVGGLVADPGLRARMSAAAAGLCDGLGAERVAARMLALLAAGAP
jgi:UDP-2,4-diacetamido-2,4,6-trideoxy-beta-L-altropyranose hydrolase